MHAFLYRYKCVVARTDGEATPDSSGYQGGGMPNAEGALREAGPEICGVWLGQGGLRFATGHQQGDVLLWELPRSVRGATCLGRVMCWD